MVSTCFQVFPLLIFPQLICSLIFVIFTLFFIESYFAYSYLRFSRGKFQKMWRIRIRWFKKRYCNKSTKYSYNNFYIAYSAPTSKFGSRKETFLKGRHCQLVDTFIQKWCIIRKLISSILIPTETLEFKRNALWTSSRILNTQAWCDCRK